MMNSTPSSAEIDVLLQGSLTGEAIRARYKSLTEFRDKTNAEVAPIQAQLVKANAEFERARLVAADLAKQIEDARGGTRWLTVKKEIGILANLITGQK